MKRKSKAAAIKRQRSPVASLRSLIQRRTLTRRRLSTPLKAP
uniref:Uncharacterized protein n=1 Tax=Arundo donax TaxID=35708 RepID=A0A0A9AIE0_ARUDO